MEFIDIALPGQRAVTLFFGPQEFAVRCHGRSQLKTLDKVKTQAFSHSSMFQTLRKFPESHIYYREMRKRYHEKVADRLHSLQTMSPHEQYQHLVATQPWVLKLADPNDVALYLGVSQDLLRQWKK
jgi:hypothetical protein